MVTMVTDVITGLNRDVRRRMKERRVRQKENRGERASGKGQRAAQRGSMRYKWSSSEGAAWIRFKPGGLLV